MYYSPKFDVMPIEELIENSKIILLEPSEDYATYEDYPTIEDELNNFLDNVKNK